MILIYTTCKNTEEAEKIAQALLREKLVACANILQSNSMYFWQNELKKENESILVLKTIKPNFEAIEQKIKKLHSYELPCILRINCEANKEFDKWVENNTNI